MGFETNLDKFLDKSHLSLEQWEASELDWDKLIEIGTHHESRFSALNDSAEFIAKSLRACSTVHSVRWRVKDTDHLLAKLVRKKLDGSDKYQDVSVENYHEKVTDLIGVRVLHLFKDDWETIDLFVNSNWSADEPTVAFVRDGDDETVYEKKGCEIKKHDAGYRSIHYIVESSPTKNRFVCEIQVRTLFEEAWSEIDHQVRYPNFSDNEVLAYFLRVFIRMAGSADEMGSFVKALTTQIHIHEQLRESADKERQEHLERIEDLMSKLESEQSQSQATKGKLSEVRDELNKLKKSNRDPLSILGSIHDPMMGTKYLDDNTLANTSLFETVADYERNEGAIRAARLGLWGSDHTGQSSKK